MNILPYKRQKIDRYLSVWLSKHFCYSDFGVSGMVDNSHHGNRYVMGDTPGTGFLVRETDSRSYHDFVNRQMAKHQSSYWRFLTGKEPNYDRELKLAGVALKTCDEPRKHELMECYINALSIGRSAEEIERIIRAVKRKLSHHSNKYLVSVIGHYKRKIKVLDRDVDSVQYDVAEHYSPEVNAAYGEMIEAFSKMISRCRRVWHHNEKVEGNFVQVFFDLGTFDFIKCGNGMPLMRDSVGTSYYLLPDAIIVARGSLDFDLIPLKDLTVVCQETAITETTELLSVRLGDAACMMLIPDLKLTFYFNHAHVVVDFVQALNKLKTTI